MIMCRTAERLWSLPKPQRRARLAELRRGVGHQPATAGAVGQLPAGTAQRALGQGNGGRRVPGPSEAEWAVYLALTLYALHQQGEENVP